MEVFCVCFGKKYISDFLTKIGRSANWGGGGGQPFSGRNSLTDHKKKLLTFSKHLKMPVKWHKKWFTCH